MEIKRGDKLEAIGYQHLKEDAEIKWPDFLIKGKHQVSKIRRTNWGVLIKTDKMPFWVNLGWFKRI